MTIDPIANPTDFYTRKITEAQYSGILEESVKKFLDRTKVVSENEKARVSRVLEEERKRIQTIVGVRGKTIERTQARGYDVKGKLAEVYEKGRLVDIII